jgi:hypothetical protein
MSSLQTNVDDTNGLFRGLDPQVTNYDRRFYHLVAPY